MGRNTIPFEQISHLEADVNYTIIHLIDGKKRISAFTLKKFDDVMLHSHFVKTHKSFIINTLYIKDYDRENSKLIMKTNKVIRVSRRRKVHLEQTIFSL